eukprot:TRINITY_DN26132_c0_g1_i1.p1 TRINITY_DN26132_c0_g1~~TRINITY_DN26132_c0_g1_i1.p1  ORF type:complete len:2057 (+),score=378.38 TRINITY_DN26132_c0_g1_i1:113-6283(+)
MEVYELDVADDVPVRGYAPGSSFEVKGAGEAYANGTYSRTAQKCHHADVFRKHGTSLVLMRRGDEGWSLVDLRGSTTLRWSLRCVELYSCFRTPPGSIPPPIGWSCTEGEGPAPMLTPGKSPLLPFLVTPDMVKKSKAKETEMGGTTSSWLSRAARNHAKTMKKSSSEPRMPRVGSSKPGPAGMGIASSDVRGPTTTSHGSSKGYPKGPSNRPAPGSLQNFGRSFSVVLGRPSARVPWGFVWNEEVFRNSGSRLVTAILENSPLERWNVWQHVNGRPDLCVMEGDRLIKTDGRWAYYEQEVSFHDSAQAGDAVALLSDAEGPERHLVLEFLRPSQSPFMPRKPRIEVWDTQASLVISWDPPSDPVIMQPYEQLWGWAVAIADLDHGLWYIVDGASYEARSLALEGMDVAVAKPELSTVYVSDGIAPGRAYAACVAMLTEHGWSAFSELSRSITLRPSAKVSDTVLGLDPEEDDWPQRPRFAVPKRLYPTATLPIELRPGPRDLFASERWIRMKACIEGGCDGLELVAADSAGQLLLVESVEPGSPMDIWNHRQESLEFHGYTLAQRIQVGDLVKNINGVTGAQAMLYEISRKPEHLVVVFEHHCGGNTTYQEVPTAKIFELHALDQEASQNAEEFNSHLLLSQAEAVVCARMVEKDGDELAKAVDVFQDILGEQAMEPVYEGIVGDADRRVLLSTRMEAVLADNATEAARAESRQSIGSRGSIGSRLSDKRLAGLGSKGVIGGNDEVVLIKLRKAMADASMDEEQLQAAITDFINSSKVVRQSNAGIELVQRATELQGLWKWRRACARAKQELASQVSMFLNLEKQYQDDLGFFTTYEVPEPPYGLSNFVSSLDTAEKYRKELNVQLNEAMVIFKRLSASNDRYKAERRIRQALKDPREDDLQLEDAVHAGEAVNADPELIERGRNLAISWRDNHQKTALHDQLFQAVKALRKHVDNRKTPGAGASEQQRMREAIAGSGLPPDDPLVVEAWQLLRKWEQDNVALRAEARLQSAVERVQGGFKARVPEAGDLLGGAIAEVAQQGVDARFLDMARTALALWQQSRLKKASLELATAMKYADEDYLKESLDLAMTAGIDEETIEQATRQLARLRMVDEVNKLMDKTMEDPQLLPLEKAVQLAHTSYFIEEDMDMLWAGSLQARLRYWAQEIQSAVQADEPVGLDHSVKKAGEVLVQSHKALDFFKSKAGTADKTPDVAIRTLERDVRALQLVLPGGRDRSAVYLATIEVERVLGAVERLASELPAVIASAQAQVSKGLSKELVDQAKQCQEEYEATVTALEQAVELSSTSGDDLKSALVSARMAGAPMELVDAAFQKLEDQFPDLFEYAKVELELLVAKQEADDIKDLSAETRFLRLQDAADAAGALQPKIEQSLLDEVDEISLALAAERSFAMAVEDAKAVLAGKPLSPDEVTAVASKLEHAITACETTAQEEAKKGIPEAEELKALLAEEAVKRKAALNNALELAAARGTPMRELIICITNARQASVPYELLAEPYAKLRKKKLDFVTTGFRDACAAGKYALAFGLYHRGLALKVAEERHGGEWRSGAIEGEMKRLKADVIRVNGEFTLQNSGGSFGTSTWRKNPCYVIRRAKNGAAGEKKGGRSGGGGIKVAVALAEAGESPATMAVHVVKNSKVARDAGCGNMLVPGFEVIAASNEDDDIPDCEFDLPTTSKPGEQIFIVPSAAHGELGPYTIVINTTEPVEVVEIPQDQKEPQAFCQIFHLQWLQERPYAVTMGGGRFSGKAPLLSWYRNPQFRIRLKDAPKKDEAPEADASPEPAPPAAPEAKEKDKRSGGISIRAFSENAEEQLLEIFKKCDPQDNGTINKRELIKIVRKEKSVSEFFGIPSDGDGARERIEGLFQAIDADQDREITWDEFLLFYQSFVAPSLSKSKASESDDEEFLDVLPPTEEQGEEDEAEEAGAKIGDANPLVMVFMTKHDGRPKAAAAAVHLVRNEDDQDPEALISENPSFHNVVACSGPPGREYSTNSEIGTVLKIGDEAQQVCPLMVIPSLKTTRGQGKFTMTVMSTRELIVERLQ